MLPLPRVTPASCARAAMVLSMLLGVVSAPSAQPSEEEDEDAALSAELALHPGDPVRLLKRAQLALGEGHLDAARADLEAAARADPDMAAIDFVLAQLEVAAGRPDAAVAAVRRFLVREPGNRAAVVLQARLVAKLSDAEASAAAWRLALDAVAASGRPEQALYLEATRGQPSRQALALLEEGISRCGNTPMLVKAAVARAVALDDAQHALALVDGWLATSEGATQPDALALRARLLAQARREGDACAALQRAEQALRATSRIGRGIRADAEADIAAARALLPGCTR